MRIGSPGPDARPNRTYLDGAEFCSSQQRGALGDLGTTLMMGERIWRTAPYAKAGVMISEQPPEAVEQPAESPGALTLTGRSIPSASIWVAKVWRAQ